MSVTVGEPSVCPNCGTPLAGRYCANCGQKKTPISPTLAYFVHDLTHELLHVDGKIFRSIWLLLARPGFLTREYFLGRRASYISPIRLYLIFSIAFFAAAALPGRPPVFEPTDEAEVGPIGAFLGLETMSAAEANEVINRARHDWVPRVMFVLVPLAALLVQVVNRGRTYPQHLYFALHVHAAIFALLALTTLVEWLIGRTSGLLVLAQDVTLAVYTVVAFREAYGGGWLAAAGRTIFVLLLYTNAITLILILGIVVTARAS
jgi:hypothetical protein